MIELESRESVAVLRLRHGRANALDVEFCRSLVKEFEKLRSAPHKAVVITGRERIFSAGVDLLRVVDSGTEYIRQLLPALHDFCEEIFTFPRPVVAAINGHAIGGGCVLACMADRRVMARDSGRIGVPELSVGVPFPPGPLEVMRFVLPARHLAQVMYGGAAYEPEEALDRGLVDEVAKPEELLDRAISSARELGRLAPGTFGLTKAQIRSPALARMRAGRKEIGASVEAIWTGREAMQSIRDYVDRTLRRRKP